MAVVLIVDDNPGTRWVLSDLVTRESHTVLEACDGKEALEVYRTSRPRKPFNVAVVRAAVAQLLAA